MFSIEYGNTTIHYNLYPQARKDIKISIDLISGVTVFAPNNTSQMQIDKKLKSKSHWIYQKLQELNEIQTVVQPKEFVSGEKLPYLGRNYRLKVHRNDTNKANIKLMQGKFSATVPIDWAQEKVQDQLVKELMNWYRHHGLTKVLQKASYYEQLLGVKANSIQLKTQHKRWGTCTPDGNIYFNWRIVLAPIHVINYVIVHELAHLKVPEHNTQFWNTVKSVLPNYEEQKEWLRIHGRELYCIVNKEKDMTNAL